MITVQAPPLPRADAPRPTAGFFSFGSTSLKGLDPTFWALLAYLFITIAALDEEWDAVARLHARSGLAVLLLLAAGVRTTRAASRSGRGPAPPNAVAAWWGAFFLATLLATVWAFEFHLAKDALLDSRLHGLLLFPLLLALVRKRRQLLLVVLVLAAAHGFYLLRSFQEFFAGRYVAAMDVKRMVGAGEAYADPNSFAASLVFSLPLVLWVGFFTRSRFLRLCVVAYGVLAGLAIVLTRSRSGLILAVLAALWFLTALPNRRGRLVGVMLLVVVAVVGVAGLSDEARRRYASMFTGGATHSERESTQGRIRGYVVAFEILGERPVLGVGPGNFAAYRASHVDGSRLLPHNLTGQLVATGGLLGGIAFLGYLLSSFWYGFRERRRRRDAVDPWPVAVRSLLGALLFTLFLLGVSGLAAHNLDRPWWYAAPALMILATTCRVHAVREDGPEEMEG